MLCTLSLSVIVLISQLHDCDCVGVIPYKTYYHQQYVNHFDYLNTQTFDQRYLLAGQ